MQPSYATNDPKGWMGDPRRGAAMGRGTVGDLRTAAELADAFAANAVSLSDALRLKENRPGDGYKASAWEAAAESFRREREELRALYNAAKAREAADCQPLVTLRRVRLDRGGYDPQGTYFGLGEPLFWAATPDGAYDRTFRAADRDAAKATVRETYPHARFYR
jgi:hypothetical protein